MGEWVSRREWSAGEMEFRRSLIERFTGAFVEWLDPADQAESAADVVMDPPCHGGKEHDWRWEGDRMMRRMYRWLGATAAVVLPAATMLIGFAAPASAGCEYQVFAQYCDGPIQPDGTWERCFVAAGQTFSGQYGQVAGWIPPVGRCYEVDPAAFPVTPLGQPPYHIGG